MSDVYKRVIIDRWNLATNHLQSDRKQLSARIKELEDKLSYIRELLSSKKIEPEDFREMKSDYSLQIDKLEAKLTDTNTDCVRIEPLLDADLTNLLKLHETYKKGEIEKKREIVSSIYPKISLLTESLFELLASIM